MAATIGIGIALAAFFAMAVRSIIKSHKKGSCCGGSCKGCHGCDLSYDEIKAQAKKK